MPSLNPGTVRVLLVADTHLGFDLPFRPRIERRRRGHDFFANLNRALQPAVQGEVDLVVHGGDLFYRSKVPPALLEMAMAPLVRVAKGGTPVYLVPGNHERSRIPLHLWATHPNIHIFDQPRTFLQASAQGRVALSGFPFARRVRDSFARLVRATGHGSVAADIHLLCMHQTVEGAQVGVNDYTFRGGPDVVRGADIPSGFAALLCGHIHRAQTLSHDLSQRRLAAPAIYPGSVERTSFAEREEEKAYAVLTLRPSQRRGGHLEKVSFIRLPARPMVSLLLQPADLNGEALRTMLLARLRALDPDSVVRVQFHGPNAAGARQVATAAYLRELAPPSMNISLALERHRHRRAPAP